MNQRILVYEYLSGGGASGEDSGIDDEMFFMGLAMRDAIVHDLAHLDGIRVSCATSARAGPVPARPNITPVWPAENESPFGFVRRQTQVHDLVWIVAPETGGVLACMRKMVGLDRWVGCDSAAIRLASSKGATTEHLARYRVPTPWDFVGARASRWVVKPDDGAGGQDTRVHDSFDSALADRVARRRQSDVAIVLEPWVDGEPMSVSLLGHGDGRVEVLCINRQMIRVDADGALHYEGVDIASVPPDDARAVAVVDLASRVARAMPGLRGFVGIDFVWHPERGPVVIEVNPRLTCAYIGLSTLLRRPLAAEIVAMFAKEAAGVA